MGGSETIGKRHRGSSQKGPERMKGLDGRKEKNHQRECLGEVTETQLGDKGSFEATHKAWLERMKEVALGCKRC